MIHIEFVYVLEDQDVGITHTEGKPIDAHKNPLNLEPTSQFSEPEDFDFDLTQGWMDEDQVGEK